MEEKSKAFLDQGAEIYTEKAIAAERASTLPLPRVRVLVGRGLG
jgi:hypothetical protein